MKKIIAFLLCAIFLLGATGCAGTHTQDPVSTPTPASPHDPIEASPPAEVTSEEIVDELPLPMFEISVLFDLDLDSNIERIFEFHEGMAAIYHFDENNPYGRVWYSVGYIDTGGNLAIPMEFPYSNHEIYGGEIPRFSEGLVRVVKFFDFPMGYFTGYSDKTGNIVIPFQFEYAYDFNGGLSPVSILDEETWEETWSIINKTGEVVLETDYYFINEFSEGFAAFMCSDEDLFGFMDTNFNVVIPPTYSGAQKFSEGLAAVATGGWRDRTWGFIDKSGELVIPFKYDYVSEFTEGFAAATTGNGLFGYIDKEGNEIIPFEFDIELNEVHFGADFTPPVFSNGLVVLLTGGWENPKVNIFNTSGNLVRSFDEYDVGKCFSEGVAAVRCRETELWGYIDMAGNLITPLKYTYAGNFSEGLAAVATGDWESLSWSILTISAKTTR